MFPDQRLAVDVARDQPVLRMRHNIVDIEEIVVCPLELRTFFSGFDWVGRYR